MERKFVKLLPWIIISVVSLTFSLFQSKARIHQIVQSEQKYTSSRVDCNQSSSSSSSSIQPPPQQQRPKIAIITGFVSDRNDVNVRLDERYFQHMINKACYPDLWNYDLVFYSQWAFPNATESQFWLQWGAWHRVPHMMAILDQYDWILYVDTDWVVQDLMYPLESFIHDWELNGQDAHVLVPTDFAWYYTFSSFAIMIRNSPFGHRLLQNWYKFSQGLCPKGNFALDPMKYTWQASDQPGLWYALAQTHYDMFQPKNVDYDVKCTDDGYIDTAPNSPMGPELNSYFQRIENTRFGVHGSELRQNGVPREQPILWSITQNETKSGLGIQKNWGIYTEMEHPHAFAFHFKGDLYGNMKQELQKCQKELGCNALYDEKGHLQLGCNRSKALTGYD